MTDGITMVTHSEDGDWVIDAMHRGPRLTTYMDYVSLTQLYISSGCSV